MMEIKMTMMGVVLHVLLKMDGTELMEYHHLVIVQLYEGIVYWLVVKNNVMMETRMTLMVVVQAVRLSLVGNETAHLYQAPALLYVEIVYWLVHKNNEMMEILIALMAETQIVK